MANLSAALRKALQTRSAEDLAQIGESWAVSKVVSDDLVQGIGEDEGLRDAVSARFAWEALSPHARDILHHMITFKIMDGVPREDLQKLVELSNDDFAAALSELERNLMLVTTRPDSKVRQRLEARGRQASQVLAIPKDFYETFMVVHQEIYDPASDRSKMQLPEVLATLDPVKFQAIVTLSTNPAAHSGYNYYTPIGTPLSVANRLVQIDVIETIWEKLDPTEQQICRWLCQADGNARVADVQTALNLSRTTMAHYIRRLESDGLIFPTFSGQEHRLFVGRGIFKVLRKYIGEVDRRLEQAKSVSSLPVKLETPPTIVHEAHYNLLSDLAVVVNAVHQMVIEPTQAGRISKRQANKIVPLLHGSRPTYYDGTDYYLDMVFAIASGLNLIQLENNNSQKAHYAPGSGLAEWSYLEAFEQARRLLELWEQGTERAWSDVAGINYRSDGYGYGYYIEAHSAREGLLAYLTEQCQPGQWYALEPFLLVIKTLQPFLLRNKSYYSAYSNTRTRKDMLANWDRMDAEIIIGMLASSLHEMGMVTLGYSSDAQADGDAILSNPNAFQFTELAAQAMWDLRTSPQETSATEHARTLIVQPNFELLLLQPDYQTLYQLLPFARVEQIEMVSRLTITQESVRCGVEAGHGVDQIVRTLQAHSQKELPQNVLYTLQDWGRLYKDATVSQVILLEVGSEAIADELCSAPKLRSLELRRLGPRAIAIGGQVSLQVLRTTLEKESVILHIQGHILSAHELASTSISGYGKRR